MGLAPKLAAHEQGRLHRAFSVYLWREGQLLLQQRAAGKYHSGGLWANACCSHPRPGEELLQAAGRRLREECGLRGAQLQEAFSFIYRASFDNGLTEHELDHVLLGYYAGEAETLAPDPEEIAALRWLSFEEIEAALAQRPQDFAVWFKLSAARVISLLRDKNSDIIY